MKRLVFPLVLGIVLILAGCNNQVLNTNNSLSVQTSSFGEMPDGQEITLYTLSNEQEMHVGIINYGGIIQSVEIPDSAGNHQDVALGFDNLQDYIDKSPYFGCITGRYANRIAQGKFTLDSMDYQLDINNGPNHLHGGFEGFNQKVWNAEEFTNDSLTGVILTYRSPDGDQGYPGNLDVTVTYSLNNDNELRIDYQATTDKTTVVNLTNHSYFNLDDGGKTPILDHHLKINADAFTPTNETLIPTGQITTVKGTPMDFTSFTTIGERIDAIYEPIEIAGGYDHNYVLNNHEAGLHLAAVVKEPDSERQMEVYTSEPGIQLYTGNFLDGTITGKYGNVYEQHHGFCLETQHFPDSPNQEGFPSTVLKPDQAYHSTTIYKFVIE